VRRRAVLVAGGLAVLALLGGLALARDGRDMGFDAEEWRAQGERGPDAFADENPRGGMAGELMREHLVAGADRDDIRELLGPPQFSQGETDVYELGRATFGVSYEQLAVEYEDGELVRAFVRRT
jgi:hypothetical protein